MMSGTKLIHASTPRQSPTSLVLDGAQDSCSACLTLLNQLDFPKSMRKPNTPASLQAGVGKVIANVESCVQMIKLTGQAASKLTP